MEIRAGEEKTNKMYKVYIATSLVSWYHCCVIYMSLVLLYFEALIVTNNCN